MGFMICFAAEAPNDTIFFSAQGGFYKDVFALKIVKS